MKQISFGGAPGGREQAMPKIAQADSRDLDKWEILRLIGEISKSLGIGSAGMSALRAHLRVLPRKVSMGQPLFSYQSTKEAIDGVDDCLTEKKLYRGEKALEEAGLIVLKTSPNKRRFPIRDGKGRVVDAYGVNLRPLFQRVAEFMRIRDELKRQAAELTAAKTRLRERVRNVRISHGHASQPLPQGFADIDNRIRNLCRRATCSIDDIAALDAELNQLVPEEAGPQISPETSPAPDSMSDADGHGDRHNKDQRKEYIKEDRFGVAVKELRQIQETWATLETISAFYPEPPTTPAQLLRTFYVMSEQSEIGKSVAGRLIAQLGISRAFELLDQVAEKIASINHPQAYVLSILDRQA